MSDELVRRLRRLPKLLQNTGDGPGQHLDRFHQWLKAPISTVELAVVCIVVATLVGGVLVGWELR